jgi:cytochrome P450
MRGHRLELPGMFKPLMRNMLDLDAPDHTRLRGLVHTVFTPRLIENLRQRVQNLTDELLNRVQNQGRMDLIHDYALQIPTTIIAEMLGVPVKDRLKFHRWSSAAVSSSASRYTREDTTVAGVTVPRGELVFAVLASANRDEQQFEQADRLDLGREPNPHVAFGLGIHYCLGASLARLEGQIAIATLLRRIPNLKTAIPSNALRWRRGLVLRGLESLPVVFTKQT